MNLRSDYLIQATSSDTIKLTKEEAFPFIIRHTKSNKVLTTKDSQRKVETENTIKSTQCRVDAYCTPITKKKKKQKVTFIDRLNPSKNICEECKVESFKSYNLTMSYPDSKDGEINGKVPLCSCCFN